MTNPIESENIKGVFIPHCPWRLLDKELGAYSHLLLAQMSQILQVHRVGAGCMQPKLSLWQCRKAKANTITMANMSTVVWTSNMYLIRIWTQRLRIIRGPCYCYARILPWQIILSTWEFELFCTKNSIPKCKLWMWNMCLQFTGACIICAPRWSKVCKYSSGNYCGRHMSFRIRYICRNNLKRHINIFKCL